jgi:hypothetical protein
MTWNRELLCRDLEETQRLHELGLSTKQIAERLGVHPPCITRRLQKLKLKPPPVKGKVRSAHPARYQANDDWPPPAINREGCAKCGVRADIGCRHNSVQKLTGWS